MSHMLVMAHILGLPVEELLPPLAGGTIAATLLWLSSLMAPLCRLRSK